MKRWRASILLVMNFFGRPSFAQSSAMEVVTLQPPTVAASAAATSTAADGAAATVVPSILYPIGNPILNNIDTLAVNYVTPWQLVDMTVSCGLTEGDDLYSFKATNLPQNGPYDLSPIQQSFRPSQYPLHCHIGLEDASTSGDTVDSGSFIMTSTAGSATRYAQTTTAAIQASTKKPSGAPTSTTSTLLSSTSSDSSAVNTSSDSSAAAASSSSSSSPESSTRHSGGLSTGGKVAIALSVLIFLALLALFLFLLLRYRRKLRRTRDELHETQANAAAAAAAHADEKAYLDSILTVAGKPDTSSGGRIVVADLGNRKSGDWRQFFAAKANSAKEAISNVGSRGNSRPGSRRASRANSRPGTATEEVPDVPSLPSPSMAPDSVQGEGSTIGLVSGNPSEERLKNTFKRKPIPVRKATS